MTFEEAVAQIEAAVREHGARVEELVVRVRNGAIPEARFVAEMVSLRQAFEKVVGEPHVGGQEQRACVNRIVKGARVSEKELSCSAGVREQPLAVAGRGTPPFEQSSDRVIWWATAEPKACRLSPFRRGLLCK
jgi:hypothetical protein